MNYQMHDTQTPISPIVVDTVVTTKLVGMYRLRKVKDIKFTLWMRFLRRLVTTILPKCCRCSRTSYLPAYRYDIYLLLLRTVRVVTGGSKASSSDISSSLCGYRQYVRHLVMLIGTHRFRYLPAPRRSRSRGLTALRWCLGEVQG